MRRLIRHTVQVFGLIAVAILLGQGAIADEAKIPSKIDKKMLSASRRKPFMGEKNICSFSITTAMIVALSSITVPAHHRRRVALVILRSTYGPATYGRCGAAIAYRHRPCANRRRKSVSVSLMRR